MSEYSPAIATVGVDRKPATATHTQRTTNDTTAAVTAIAHFAQPIPNTASITNPGPGQEQSSSTAILSSPLALTSDVFYQTIPLMEASVWSRTRRSSAFHVPQ